MDDAAIDAALALISGETGQVISDDQVDASLVEEALALIALPQDLDAEIEVEDEPAEVTEDLSTAPLEEVEIEDVTAALAELEAKESAAVTPAAPATPKKTRTVRTTEKSDTPASARVFTDVAEIDQATLKERLDRCTAKKVTEKAINVVQAVEQGKKLSRYTADAVTKLKTDGRVSSKALVDEFLSKGLGDGTARAQAQQMTALFKMLGIAMPDPTNSRELVIADAVLVDELVALAA